jgi:hypothetical protein
LIIIYYLEIEAEQAKFRRKREEAEARRNRFLSPRARTIGVDVNSLNEQVSDSKNKLKQIEIEKKLDVMRNREIDLIMESIEHEQRKMKQFYMEEVKKSWEISKTEKKDCITPKKFVTSPDICGPAACQKFAGEDPTREDRIREQKKQMRQWVQEKVGEIAQIKERSKEDEDNYNQLLKAVDKLREEAEDEEKKMREHLNRYVVEENKVLAKEQEEKRRQWNKIGPSMNGRNILSDLDDNVVPKVVDGSKIAHKDAFRGLTKAQQYMILKQNDDLVEQKREAERQHKMKENEFNKHQSHVLRAMDLIRLEEERLKAEENASRVAELKMQADEHKKRSLMSKKDQFGAVNEGFFGNFGTSCR